MADNKLEIWNENDGQVFYKWPFYNIGVQMQPAAALNDALKTFESLLIEKESAGRVLARLIDQGAKAGVSLKLHISNMDEALEGLSEKHRLKASVSSMNREGFVHSGKVSTVKYDKGGLRRIFGLS